MFDFVDLKKGREPELELCPDLVAELEPESVGVIVEAEDSRLLQSACSFILQILARSSTRFPMCDPE